MAIFAVCVALVFLTGLIPIGGNGVLLHVLYLFPINALNAQILFSTLVSYQAGPLVVDLAGVLAGLYALVLVACVPAAAIAFRCHQVM